MQDHARPAAAKATIRARIRAGRSAESDSARSARAAALRRRAATLLPLATGGTLGFQPTNHEPDVSGLLVELLASAPVYLPRVAGEQLEWVAARSSELHGGGRGIPRPPGPAVAVGAAAVTGLGVTLILVPALAVDPATGTRLGYGAGHYDRFLAAVPDRRAAAVVAVCRDMDLVDLPIESHDQPMDAVLTESGLRRCCS